MPLKSLFKLFLAIAICETAGFIGSIFTAPSITSWYADLTKPALNPPNWVFGPVWTTLYALMGVAVFLIWSAYEKAGDSGDNKAKKRLQNAICLFAVQLLLNVLWSGIFFGLHSPGAAFIEIIFLWLAILLTILAFYRAASSAPLSTSASAKPWTSAGSGKLAAILLIPYLLWVTFAAYLNLAIWLIN